ncbi:MAG TPA: response regulator [Gemmatimonadales bacterium]|nr:response regulator [Gemmatimonadales bacterium]
MSSSSSRTVFALVVDDVDMVREAIRRYLQRHGCRVTTARDGVEGLEAIRARAYDAVIADLRTQRRGATWLYEQALMFRPDIRGRFVFCTSPPLPGPAVMSLVAGSERFLLKPFSLEAIWQQVREIVADKGNGRRASAPRIDVSPPPVGALRRT